MAKAMTKRVKDQAMTKRARVQAEEIRKQRKQDQRDADDLACLDTDSMWGNG